MKLKKIKTQDSVIAETIAVSSDEDRVVEQSDEDRVVEQPAVPSLPDRLRGPANIRPSPHSASSSARPVLLPTSKASSSVSVTPKASGPSSSSRAAVRITANNPLIRTLPVPERVSVPEPDYLPTRLLQVAGVAIEPERSEKFRSAVIVSIDWHQVLDCVRGWDRSALRPVPHYSVLPVISRAIHSLRERLPCFVCINSYCHSPACRSGVLSAFSHGSAAGCFDAAIVTRERRGRGGKLWALEHIISDLRGSRVTHLDDNSEILSEFRAAGHCALGIRVPRKPKASNVEYFANVVEGLNSIH